MLEELDQHGTGVLITVDEVHSAAAALRELAVTYQHFVREARNVALVMAGLPSTVSDLLNDDVMTFLRRANREHLADVELDDVRDAFRQTIEEGGRSISSRALDHAAAATRGYPFLIQLVGYHVWAKARTREITEEDVVAGVSAARRRLGSTVHEASLAGLSQVDRTFLVAMAQDDGPSRTGDVGARIGADANYTSQYRLRLIEAGLIESAGHGRIDFTLPYLREFLREHAASYGLHRRTATEARRRNLAETLRSSAGGEVDFEPGRVDMPTGETEL